MEDTSSLTAHVHYRTIPQIDQSGVANLFKLWWYSSGTKKRRRRASKERGC